MEEPSIYGALEGVASALTSTVKLLERAVNDWERREEELRDAHLDLANALNRRMDELHSRVDEIEPQLTAARNDAAEKAEMLLRAERQHEIYREHTCGGGQRNA